MKMLNIHSYFRLEPRLRFLDSFAKLKKSPDQLGLRQSLLHGLEPLLRAAVAVRLNFLEERREAPRCAQDPEHAHIPQVRLARPAPKKTSPLDPPLLAWSRASRASRAAAHSSRQADRLARSSSMLYVCGETDATRRGGGVRALEIFSQKGGMGRGAGRVVFGLV